MKEGERINQHTHTHTQLIDADGSVVIARGKGRRGEMEVGKGMENGDGKRLCFP